MDIKIEQHFDVIIEQQYNARGRFQHEYRVDFLQELQSVIKGFRQIVKVNIPTFVSIRRVIVCKYEDSDYSVEIEISDRAKKELDFLFVRGDVPTVDYLERNIAPKSKLKCKYDKNMPAYYENRHVLQPIRLLKPKEHIVVKQDSLQQLYPTPTDALPEKVKNFFEERIYLVLAHSGMSVKGREKS